MSSPAGRPPLSPRHQEMAAQVRRADELKELERLINAYPAEALQMIAEWIVTADVRVSRRRCGPSP